jgi:hypothetical protein
MVLLKFKIIFIFFNILLIASFVCILSAPFFMLGGEYVKIFWKTNWYFAALFFAAFLGLNTFFLYRWKLFSLIENEDWKGVCQYLQQRIYGKNRESRQTVRILINTYIVLADMEGLKKLSRHLEEKKSRFFAVFALELGIPYISGDDPAAQEAYFARAVANPKTRRKDWLRWNLAFAQLRTGGRDRQEAAAGLAALIAETKDPVLCLLSAYLLYSSGEPADDNTQPAARARDTLRQKYTRSAWEKVSQQSRNSLIGLLLSKLLDEAENWLFENKE